MADDYFIIALEVLADKLNMSEDVVRACIHLLLVCFGCLS